MTEISNSAIAAIREASTIKLTLDEGSGNELVFTFGESGIGSDLSKAIYEYFRRHTRQDARRKTLYQVLAQDQQGKNLMKWLKLYGVEDWQELDDITLIEFKDYLLKNRCQSTVSKYLEKLSSVIRTYSKVMGIPSEEYSSILKVQKENSLKTFLNPKDLIMLELVNTNTKKEDYCKHMFLVSSYTGCRISDAIRLTKENLVGNNIVYVSKKTKTPTTIPMKPMVREWLEHIWELNTSMTTAGIDCAIKRLCKRAGINDRVTVFRAGKEQTGEKWKYISSHNARISFATNLSDFGMQIQHIASMMGHADTKMTLHYIVSRTFALPAGAMQYFG